MNRWKPALALLGTFTLAAACSIDDPIDPDAFNVPEPVATLLAAVSGDGQTGGAGEALAEPLVVRVLDQFGRPVEGVAVNFSVVSGGGSLAPVATTTDDEGNASTSWTLGPALGAQQVQATTDPATTTVLFDADAGSGAVAVIQLTPDTLRFDALGDTARIQLAAQDAFGNAIDDPDVDWRSDLDERASVNQSGLVTATGGGTTRILAQAGEAIDTVVVVVTQAPATLELVPATDTLIGAGDSVALRARVFDRNGRLIPQAALTWSTADSAIATVSDEGVVLAVDSGTTTILAVHDTVSDSTIVTVRIPVAIAVSPEADTLDAVGDTLRLSATLTDADGDTIDGARVDWVSLDTLLAKVDAFGRVTARDTGTVSIVVSFDTLADTAAITIAPDTSTGAPRRAAGAAGEDGRGAPAHALVSAAQRGYAGETRDRAIQPARAQRALTRDAAVGRRRGHRR